MKRKLIAAIAACGIAAPTFAVTGNNHVDGYFALSELDIGSFDDDGNGFGLKGAFQVHPQVFLTGEFQSVEYDDTDLDLDQIRLGAGTGPGMGANGEGIYGRGEYIQLDADSEDQDGLVGTLGYALSVNPQFRLHGEVGYVYLDDADGPELLVGGTYRLAQNLGLFADYRMSFLDPDGGGGDLDVADLRAGVRFHF